MCLICFTNLCFKALYRTLLISSHRLSLVTLWDLSCKL